MLQNAPQLTSVANLVATGIAVTIVPASMASVSTEGVRYCEILGRAPTAPIVLARTKSLDNPAAQIFSGLVIERGRRAR